MAVERVDRESHERRDLIRPEPEAVHTRVDHHVAWAGRCRFLPARDLHDGVEHWRCRGLQSGTHIVRPHAVKHRKPSPFRNLSKFLGLRPDRNEEVAAACAMERIHRLTRAEPISIRLDGGAGRDSRLLRERTPIADERGAVDGQAEWTVHRMRTSWRPVRRRGAPSPAPSFARRTAPPTAQAHRRGNGR